MSFYTEWIDFVNYPNDPNRVLTKEARLDCSKAIGATKKTLNSAEEINQQADLIDEFGLIITEDRVVFEDDDEFQVMQITDYGAVLIFTKKRVWTLQRQGIHERLIFLPRHPEYSHL